MRILSAVRESIVWILKLFSEMKEIQDMQGPPPPNQACPMPAIHGAEEHWCGAELAQAGRAMPHLDAG